MRIVPAIGGAAFGLTEFSRFVWTGKSPINLSSPVSKNFSLFGQVETEMERTHPVPTEGRFANVKEVADERARRAAWKHTEANAARLAEYQSPMRRGASRGERIDEAVRLIREGASLRWASEAVRLPNAKRAIARRCDQRGVARKPSPALPQWETHIPDPVIVPPPK